MMEGSRTPAAEAVSSFSGLLPTNTCASAAQVFPRHRRWRSCVTPLARAFR